MCPEVPPDQPRPACRGRRTGGTRSPLKGVRWPQKRLGWVGLGCIGLGKAGNGRAGSSVGYGEGEAGVSGEAVYIRLFNKDTG